MKRWLILALLPMLSACQSDSGMSVSEKVLVDFGIKDRPEGYVSGADQVYARLGDVGELELKRLNQETRQGTIEFEQAGLRGVYFKRVKVYENFHPLDAQPLNRSSQGGGGYQGYVEYRYRIYESPRKPSRTEAAAELANIPTDVEGREAYRYRFNTAGAWDGGKGEAARR